MYPGVVASIVCPACGQPFLCQQQAPESMVSCPHCAHQGLRVHFPTQGQTASLANVRRRVSRPLHEPPTPPQPSLPPLELSTPTQPRAWTAPVHPPPEQIVWRQPTNQTPVAMQPMQTYSEAAQEANFVPHHLQRSPMRWIGALVVLAVVSGAAAWVWWDMSRGNAISIVSSTTAPSGTISPPSKPVGESTPEVRRAEIATLTESTAATLPPPDVAAITADAKRLIDELFGADTPERRLACINDGARYADQIEGLLGAGSPERPKLHLLASIKGLSQALPGGRQFPLFNVVTSTCKEGALVRLIEGFDGVRRIDWPLFFETHEQTLRATGLDDADRPLWSWARLVLSHGFELPAEERSRFIVFQLHVTATGKSPMVACVERDTPLGRMLERETDWRRSYVARLLLRPAEMSPSSTAPPIFVIVDCEGAAETREAKSAPNP